jgi:FlaA1/EpsC-like NDP-sugar epimerase
MWQILLYSSQRFWFAVFVGETSGMRLANRRYTELVRSVVTMPRSTKRLIMGAADAIGFVGSAVLATWLIGPVDKLSLSTLAILALAAGIPAMQMVGFYRTIVRFMGSELLLAACRAVLIVTLVMFAMTGIFEGWLLAARHAIAFGLLALFYVAFSRTIARLVLLWQDGPSDRVIIYGAGDAGASAASAMSGRSGLTVIAYVDDNPALHGAVVNGLPVHPPATIASLVDEFEISSVLLALPSVTRRRRKRIINRLEQLPVHVQTIPELSALILGRARVDDIREVEIEDLLGRDVVAPIPELLGPHISLRSVMVTGAGGSIGSELSVQILQLEPRCLILLELSEPALYKIDQQLNQLKRQGNLRTQIVPLIGSAHHKSRVAAVLKAYGVNTIYHAAAYKHVPLVEHNMLEGIHNNVFGTLHTAEAAIDAGVESFVLISTDKAVKPANVMGATKRYAEMILQALDQRDTNTRFSLVRFGNVLASSGSVVPRFREQIRAGGPVTVTHPEIYRYFMTIPEAASLVLQAGSMAKGGEVFVLDMGEPVRIVDLAEKMIHLMGLTIRNEDNRDGDIEIEFTGLRPGEKLYEELLIGDDVSGTKHPRIMQAREHCLSWPTLKPMLDRLWDACQLQDCVEARELLLEGVVGYTPTAEVEDLVWRHRKLRSQNDASTTADNVTRFTPRRGPAA